ncbi:polyprenyl diphosphate synthase [soil metagenome]
MKLKLFTAGVVALIIITSFYFWSEIDQVDHSLTTALDVAQVEDGPLVHLACIMDGNRRWAKQRGLDLFEGHKEGIEAAKKTIEFCLENKIKYLSLYTFSTENFKRSEHEIKTIFGLMLQEAHKGIEECKKHDIRIRFIGDRSLFPAELVPYLDQFEKETAHCQTLQVSFLFCYGAQQEIAAAAKNIARKVKAGQLAEEDITPGLINQHLWTHELPEPDMIIRTGNVSRLSNFLLFQAAYAELCMLDCFWPDITKDKLQHVYDNFLNRQRRFGT